MVRLKLEDPPEESMRHADASTNTGPLVPADRFARRVALSLCVSLLVNVALWTLLSGVVRNHLIAPRPPITFKIITLPPPPKHKKIVPPKPPKAKPPPKPLVVPQPVAVPKPTRTPPPPPEHQHILTATGPSQATNTALPGGNAPVGVPIAQQSPGENKPVKTPPPTVAPPPVTPPPAPPPPAPKPTPPLPVGPSQDAVAINQVNPTIPDDLLNEDYKAFVRVKVEVAADGSFAPVLVTSSGNSDIDQLVLEALKKWKWKPALQNGVPVASSERFRFNFVVQ